MNKINIYIVMTPFQMLSAIEAKEYHKDFDSLLVIKYTDNKKNNKLIENLLILSNWDKIIRISYKLSIIEDFKILYQIGQLKKREQIIYRIFIGCPFDRNSQWFCEKLNIKECFMLDDGIRTLDHQKRVFSKEEYFQRDDTLDKTIEKNLFSKSKNLLKLFAIEYIFRLKERNTIKYNLFTCFDLKAHKKQKVIQHKFSYIKNIALEINQNKNTVYFYGSPISEVNIVSFTSEMNMIKQVNHFYLKKGKKLFYIPHRTDSNEKIVHIKKLGIKIKRFNNIAEVEPIINKTLPSDIASFISTTLLTLGKIYQYNSIISFKIPESLIERNDKKVAINDLYTEYENNIKVIPLNI